MDEDLGQRVNAQISLPPQITLTPGCVSQDKNSPTTHSQNSRRGSLDPTHLVSSLSTCVTLVNVLNLSVPFFEHW